MKNSWDMRGGKRFWDDQQQSLKDPLWQMCVKAKCKCVLWVLGWDGVPQGGLLSVLMLRDYTAYPSKLGAISQRLLRPSKQIQPGIDFWLRICIFLCPATSANLANTNLTSNNGPCGAACQFRCAPRHLGPLWLCLPRSSPLRLFSSELSASRAPVSRGLHHGTLHLPHMHPHTV